MKTNHTILHMDDDPDDLEMLREALKKVDSTYRIIEAVNGEIGIRMLKEMKEANNLPCLIVLDLNMPRMDGRKTFLSLKADDVLATIPVVIFSTSSNSMDKLFFAGKNIEYIVKPIHFEHLVDVAQRLLSLCHH